MKDAKTGWTEADITINGHKLSFAESMTVRVALTSYHMSIVNPDTANLLGPIAEGYRQNLEDLGRKLLDIK